MPTGNRTGRRGGRQPGQLNRRTVLGRERLEALGFDPLEVLVAVARGDELEGGRRPAVADQVAAARDLRRLLYPDAKADDPQPLDLAVGDLADGADLRTAIGAAFDALRAGKITVAELGVIMAALKGARTLADEEGARANAVTLEELMGR